MIIYVPQASALGLVDGRQFSDIYTQKDSALKINWYKAFNASWAPLFGFN